MDRIRAVVQHIVNFQNHSLVDVETPPGDIFHDCRVLTRIYQLQFPNRLAEANYAAIGVTDWAFLVVDQQYLAVGHHAVTTSGAKDPNSLDSRIRMSIRMLKKCMTPSSTITSPIFVLRNSIAPTNSVGLSP